MRLGGPLSLLIFWLGLVSLPAAAHSRQEREPALQVISQEAEPSFPDSVTFSLEAIGFPPARATLLFRMAGEAITSRLEADPPTPALSAGITSTLSLSLTLDLATAYIPPGADVEYYWSLQDASGKSVDTPTETFTLVDTRFQWEGAGTEDRRITVYSYGRDADLSTFMLNTASSALDRIEEALDTRLPGPASIWVYSSEDDLLSAHPQGLPEWIGGEAFPEIGLVLSVVEEGEEARSEIKRVLPHEISHLVVYHATRNPYNTPPRWLQEGLAAYNEEAPSPQDTEILRQAAESGRISPLRALNSSFGPDEETVSISYAQSRSVVTFIMEDPRYGPEKLAATFAAFREGVTYDEAMQQGLGTTMDDLDGQWRASLPYPITEPSEGSGVGDQGSGAAGNNTFALLALGAAGGLAVAAITALVALFFVRRARRKRET